jgi:hypothetical protein
VLLARESKDAPRRVSILLFVQPTCAVCPLEPIEWTVNVILQNWTPEKNQAWIQNIIDNKGIVYEASPELPQNRYDEANDRWRPFGMELMQLENAGYTRRGDYLTLPGGKVPQ